MSMLRTRIRAFLPQVSALGGGALGKTAEQMSKERGRQTFYSTLPIMNEVRKLRIEIDPVYGPDGEILWPAKTIAFVDPTRDDVKLLNYQDTEKVQQNPNYTFSEHCVIGVEDLTDPLMYDNFIDLIISFGKRTITIAYNTYLEGDVYLWTTIVNRAERTVRIYFEGVMIYNSETVPRKWKHSVYDLKKIEAVE